MESQLPRSDGSSDQDKCVDLPEGQEPDFPVAELARLDEMINRISWIVPVLPKGKLEVLLDAAMNLSKLGLDTRSEACQRFYRDGLTTSFKIILTNEAVSGWGIDVLRGIMKNSEYLVHLCVLKLNQNCLPLLELLALVLNPNCRFHTFNGTKPPESVPAGSQSPDDAIFARPSDLKTPKGWLVDLINKFGNLGGFRLLLERFQSGNALSIPVIAALIKPFGMCHDFLTVRTIQKYFMPLVEIVPAFLDNLTDDELNEEAENDQKIDALCGIVETLKCLATKVPNQEITVKNLEIFHLNMILRLLQIPSFNGKMKALDEVNTLIRSILNFKQNPEDEDRLTAVDEWIKTNKVLQFILKDINQQPQTFSDRPWLDLQQNYVVIAAANYESLAEIISSSKNDGMELFQNSGRSLKWEDFSVESDTALFVLPDKRIYSAIYRPQEKDVMLMIMPRKQSTPQNARNLNRYPVLASFTDNLHRSQISVPSSPFTEWASVYVLQRCTVTTVERFAENTALQKDNQQVNLRNCSFVLLQLINSIKSLQAEGIEEVSCDLSRLILAQSQEDKPPVFALFPEDATHMTLCENRKTLCQTVLSALYFFLRINQANDLDECEMNGERLAESVAHIFKAIAKVLLEEKASSLSQAKWFLEYMLWGPVDVKTWDCQTDLNNVLQRWLDFQRAQMVKSIISQLHNSHLQVYEEYQLVFLLHSSVKSLKSIISKL